MTKTIKTLIIILLTSITIYVCAISSEYIINIFKFIFRIILPFLISFVIAFIMQPLVAYLQKKLKRRGLAVLVVFTLFVGIIFFASYVTIPFLFKEIEDLSVKMPVLLNQLEEMMDNFGEKFSFLPDDYKPTFDNINDIITKYFNNLSMLPDKILSKIFSVVSVIIIIPMILIYFLLDYEKIICYIRDKLIEKGKVNLKNYLGEIHQMMSAYFRGAFLIMFILSILSTIAFSIIGLDYALFFGIICGVTDIIPYLGPYLGGILPVLYALTSSTQKAIFVIIVIAIIQTLESMFLSPYIYGKKTNNHPLIVLLSLSVFGALFGIVGMLIAVPIVSIIRITYDYFPSLHIFKNKKEGEEGAESGK